MSYFVLQITENYQDVPKSSTHTGQGQMTFEGTIPSNVWYFDAGVTNYGIATFIASGSGSYTDIQETGGDPPEDWCEGSWQGSQQVTVNVRLTGAEQGGKVTILQGGAGADVQIDNAPPTVEQGRVIDLDFSRGQEGDVSYTNDCGGFTSSPFMPPSASANAKTIEFRLPAKYHANDSQQLTAQGFSNRTETWQVKLAFKLSKDEAKKVAAAGAVGMNDAAAVLAGGGSAAGGVAWKSGGTGGGVAAELGIFSGLAWWMANRYQEVANDPPRNDYQTVTIYTPIQFQLPPPANDAEATWQDMSKQMLLTMSAMEALVASLERYDGTVTAAAQGTDISTYQPAQIDAIAQNATACAQLLIGQVALQPRVNSMWQQLLAQAATSGMGSSPLTKEQLTSFFATVWANAGSFQQQFQLSDNQMTALQSIVNQSIEVANLPATLPNVLLDDSWVATTMECAVEIQALAYDYSIGLTLPQS